MSRRYRYDARPLNDIERRELLNSSGFEKLDPDERRELLNLTGLEEPGGERREALDLYGFDRPGDGRRGRPDSLEPENLSPDERRRLRESLRGCQLSDFERCRLYDTINVNGEDMTMKIHKNPSVLNGQCVLPVRGGGRRQYIGDLPDEASVDAALFNAGNQTAGACGSRSGEARLERRLDQIERMLSRLETRDFTPRGGGPDACVLDRGFGETPLAPLGRRRRRNRADDIEETSYPPCGCGDNEVRRDRTAGFPEDCGGIPGSVSRSGPFFTNEPGALSVFLLSTGAARRVRVRILDLSRTPRAQLSSCGVAFVRTVELSDEGTAVINFAGEVDTQTPLQVEISDAEVSAVVLLKRPDDTPVTLLTCADFRIL